MYIETKKRLEVQYFDSSCPVQMQDPYKEKNTAYEKETKGITKEV